MNITAKGMMRVFGLVIALAMFLAIAFPLTGDVNDGRFMLRDGSRPMTGDLEMSGNDINNAGNVNYSSFTVDTLEFGDGSEQSTAQATAATFVVCASNAVNPWRCDYQTDGTDDHVQVQAAIDAANAAGGASVELSEGNFHGHQLTIKSYVSLRGQGYNTTYTLDVNRNEDIIYGSAVQGARIQDFRLEGDRNHQTQGNGIYCNDCYNFWVTDMVIFSVKDSTIYLNKSYRAFVMQNQLQWSGIGVTLEDIPWGQVSVSDNAIYATSSYGINIIGTMGVTVDLVVEDNLIRETGNHGIRCYSTGFLSCGVIVGNHIFFGAGAGIWGNGYMYDTDIVGNNINDYDYGIYIDTGHTNNVSGNGVRFIGQEGIHVGGNYNLVHGNALDTVCDSANNIYSAIKVDGEYNHVADNYIRTSGSDNKCKYGIEETAEKNNNAFVNNYILNAATASIQKVGADTYVRDNKGWVTESKGTGTITSGTTSAIVDHGLAVTPSAGDCWLAGLEDPTNPVGTMWVDTYTSTQFTVHVENDPGASNWDFAWICQVR